MVSPFAGIGGGLFGGVAFGDSGRRYGTAVGLTWGLIAGVAPYPFLNDPPSIFIAALWGMTGLAGAGLGLPIGLYLGKLVRPIVLVFHELRPYLSEMVVPFAGFVSGYIGLVLLFTGLIGSLWRLDPEGAFTGFTSTPSFYDFVYFSVAAATGGSTQIEALSLAARLIVALEAIFAQGWMIAVFAAVGAHLTPRFSRISAGSAE